MDELRSLLIKYKNACRGNGNDIRAHQHRINVYHEILDEVDRLAEKNYKVGYAEGQSDKEIEIFSETRSE